MLSVDVQIPGRSEPASIELPNTSIIADLKSLLKEQFSAEEFTLIYDEQVLEDAFRINFLPFVPNNPVLVLKYQASKVENPQEEVQKETNESKATPKQLEDSYNNEFISQPPTPKFIPPQHLSNLYALLVQVPTLVTESSKEKCIRIVKRLRQRQNEQVVIETQVQEATINPQHQESIIDVLDDRNPNNETVLNLLDTIQEGPKQNYISDERKLEIQKEQVRILHEQIEKEKKAKLEQLESEKQQRRQLIQQRLEEEKQKRELSLQLNKDGNRIIKQVKNQMLQEQQEKQKRQEQLLMEELERRKKALAEKRELAKPLSLQNILEHAKKHESDLKILMMERQHQRVEDDLRKQQLSVPKSKYHVQIEQEDKELREKDKKDKEEKKKLVVRKQKYAEVIKDMFIPKKKPSIQQPTLPTPERIQFNQYESLRQHAATNYSQSPVKGKQSREMYSTKNTTTSTIKERFKFPSKEQLMISEDVPKVKIIRSTLPPLIKKKSIPKSEPQQEDILPTKRPNYLAEMRLKRQSFKQEDIEKQIKTNDQSSLQALVRKLDTEVQRKQQLMKSIENEDEVNELYVQSIKAKLALLSK